MGMFKVTIKRSVRIQAPLISRPQRVFLGNLALGSVRGRIQKATDANDQPAKPLSAIRPRHGGASYVVQKQKRTGRRPVRDWNLTGALMQSFRVTIATAKRIVISPTDDQKVKLAGNQAICEMFAFSPKDAAVTQAAVIDAYVDMAQRMVVATAMYRAAGNALITQTALNTSA